MSSIFAEAQESAGYIAARLPPELCSPKFGIVCGSGLGGLADTVRTEPRVELSYNDIPHFPQSTVEGHAGKFVFGLLGEKKTAVVIMVGRVHYFEGHTIQKVSFPTRVMNILGIEILIITNAAGGLNREFAVGDIMVLNDHINLPGLTGTHPLRGPNELEFGTRFPAMSEAYDLPLRRVVHRSYKSLRLANPARRLHEGVYVYVSGPSFETRAECRMLKAMGADVVGMSTVPEVIAARHCGVRVLALSLVTNSAVLEPPPRGDSMLVEEAEVAVGGEGFERVLEAGVASHEEVLETGVEAGGDLKMLVERVVDDVA